MSQQNYQNQQYPVNQPQPEYIPARPVSQACKSKFLTFCFALIPGVGQMYQGLMKKGMSLMLMFFGVIAISATLYFAPLTIILPVIWFYAFFDAVNRMNYSYDELEAVEDNFIPNIALEKTGKLDELLKNRHAFIGWVLTLIGIYAMLQITIMNNYDLMMDIFGDRGYEVIRILQRTIPGLFIPIICIIIGIKLISGSRPKREKFAPSETLILKEENEND